ncbi:phosphoribosylanthranilate isomerase [Desulforhopalus singaporensis]|uniref:N-(5'-phosphoribosyl)anthranilate isomerase n=1 Tax=Desulforhopalus singaporensis TaxID=91360 RepID=A0A1H0U6N9_9BACT|nr:phosphoribosylanthranilate isomerase [Desulforhopalus singaporensis]SDP61496.1 phosphoribosylanthranilate isomerase [Desulforhopalus singaporensis]
MTHPKTRRIRIKMCGTTRVKDALFAAELGVDALGFIFVKKSKRYVTREKAAEIIDSLPIFVDRVGVFVNSCVDEVVTCATQAGLSCIQLHGEESADYCRRLRQALPSCRIIKAFRVGVQSRAEEFSPYNDCVEGFLLDTYVAGTSGGTGKVFDWSIIDGLKLQLPFLLAGGLTPDNVVAALKAVTPYGLDVNSGVEILPGIKDLQKLELFFQRAAGGR